MAGGLLTLTFHQPSIGMTVGTMAEDLLFKQQALASGLVNVEAMEAAGPPEPALMATTTPGSGLVAGDQSAKPLISFNRVGAAAWERDAFKKGGPKGSSFAKWMQGVFATPVECLVLAGHFSHGVLWGLEAPQQNGGHRPYTAFLALPDSSEVGIAGHPVGGTGDPVLRAGPFPVKNALKTCRLILIWGCNGAAMSKKHWGAWRDLVINCGGTHPLILGYYQTHRWPRDNAREHFSERFWSRLGALGGSIPDLCANRPNDVIAAWTSSMKDTFPANGHCNRHLFFQKKFTKKCEGYGPRGAGAVDSTGQVWHVVDDQGTPKPRP